MAWRRPGDIIWTNTGILLIGPLGTNFSEILIEMHTFAFMKMHFKMSSGKWRPFSLGLNVLIEQVSISPQTICGLSMSIKRSKEKIIYSKIFEEDTEPLREIANEIIKIEECLKEHQLHSMSSSNRSEPPGWPGRMHRYYYTKWCWLSPLETTWWAQCNDNIIMTSKRMSTHCFDIHHNDIISSYIPWEWVVPFISAKSLTGTELACHEPDIFVNFNWYQIYFHSRNVFPNYILKMLLDEARSN